MLQTLFRSRHYSTSLSKYYDVVIAGGGMIGGTMALALKKSKTTKHLSVALLDGHTIPSILSSNNNDNNNFTTGIRVSALTNASTQCYEQLGIWDQINANLQVPCTAYDNMEVWDEMGGGILRFKAEDLQKKQLGHIIDNDYLLKIIYKNLQQENLVTLLPHQMKPMQMDQEEISSETLLWRQKLQIKDSKITSPVLQLELDNSEKVETSLLIAADGANSPLRSQLQIPTVQWNYNQKALVCTVETFKPHHTAYQRFLKTGPIAMLPCGNYGKYSNIVWSTTPEHAQFLQSLPLEKLVEAINTAFYETVNENSNDTYSNIFDRTIRSIETMLQLPKQNRGTHFSVGVGPTPPPVMQIVQQPKGPNVASFPLKRLHVSQYVKPKVAIIGDAAHACHPLAGQGVNMGLVDVITLTKTLQEALESGVALGDYLFLQQHFEKPQKLRNEIVLEGLEVIKSMFATNHETIPGFPFIRAMGMAGIDKVHFLKKKIVEAANYEDISVTHLGTKNQ